MAGTITTQLQVDVVHGTLEFSRAITAVLAQATQGGPAPGFVTIGSGAEEDLAFGDSTPEFLLIINLDDTNFIKVGPKSGGVMINYQKVSPGMFAILEILSGVTLRAIADTAGCNCHFYGFKIA